MENFAVKSLNFKRIDSYKLTKCSCLQNYPY